MKGKWIAKTALTAGILLGAALPAPQLWGTHAYAQTAEAAIASGLNAKNYVLTDGSLRAEGRTIGAPQESSPFVGLTRDSRTGERYAWTESGSVYRWGSLGLTGGPEKLTDAPPIAQVSSNVMLTKSGEVVGYAGAGLPAGVKISAHPDGFALLTADGQIWRYRSDYASNKTAKIGDLPGTKDIQTSSSYVMALGADGTVTKLDSATDSQPETLTQNAVSLAWVKEEARSDLYVAKSDGSLWLFEYGSGKGEPVSAVKGAAAVSPAENGLFVRLSSGTTGLYADGKWSELAPARLQEAKLTLSRSSAAKGDKISTTVEERYSDGTRIKRSASASELKVSDPKVASVRPDGSLQAAGIGSTTVTLTSGALVSQATLLVKQEGTLSGAGVIDSGVYLPLRPVFAALGASIANSGSDWTIGYGDAQIKLRKGSDIATVNGKTVKLKGKVQTLDGQTVFPAGFLSSAVAGASVAWDGKFQQAIVSIGTASFEVESKQTPLLRKKQQLGSLAPYLGKSYWINGYSGAGVRFSKLTVADIKISETSSGRSYTIVFANAAGSQFAASSTDAYGVASLLSDTDQFFPFDPQVRYGGSDKIWNYIRGNYVAPGMNKQHVLLSWGEPSSIENQSSPQGPIEVWIYMRGGMKWQAVGFSKGIVFAIL
ncbi:copper amine oxidase N-terminal domain-containing protein [Saccharibacillus sp. O23]|uniref:copper amine oxidase N-terminal domain-containing protein n=1 Tax=Saccharibacillus sp. O23 TaxID=2009338 RepID=UPI0015C60D30|nr:copper amine oxidase N-terminal domain-containing protein [Saccharibacillus sp. O23]